MKKCGLGSYIKIIELEYGDYQFFRRSKRTSIVNN